MTFCSKKINNTVKSFLGPTKVMSKRLKLPDFDSIPVSTKTFVVMTNIKIDLEKIFSFLPVTKYIVVPKKRGRRKTISEVDPNKDIPSGSIITLEFEDEIRGVDLKKKKNRSKKKGNHFRNSVSTVMIIDNKKVNFKITRNGKFQMTGCKFDIHAEKCVNYIWKYIKEIKSIYNFENNEKQLAALFIPAMRNIDFGLGFNVDRQKLDEYFNIKTPYNSLLEASFGYTGVNIKIPLKKSILDLKIKKLIDKNGEWGRVEWLTYLDYLNLLPGKEKDKKVKKDRHNTFLVFHSGKIIMSGIHSDYMKDTYYEFVDIINTCQKIIQERLIQEI